MARTSAIDPMARFNDLQKQGFMKFKKPKKDVKPKLSVSCSMCLNWHEEGKHNYVVWSKEYFPIPKALDSNKKIFSTLKEAKEYAKIASNKTGENQVVTLGFDSSVKGFKVIGIYSPD